MSKNYKCSLFCSFYKGQKFIEGYLKDVFKQTIFNEIEFIFLDCDSPDNEKSRILPLAEEYLNGLGYILDKEVNQQDDFYLYPLLLE